MEVVIEHEQSERGAPPLHMRSMQWMFYPKWNVLNFIAHKTPKGAEVIVKGTVSCKSPTSI